MSQIDQFLTDYTTTTALNTLLSNYATLSYVNTKLSDYTTTTALNTWLSSYATLSYVNTELSDYTTTTDLTTLLLGKNDSLNFPAGGGSPLIDASYNNVRRIDTNSPLSYTVQNGVTIKLSCDSCSKSESDT